MNTVLYEYYRLPFMVGYMLFYFFNSKTYGRFGKFYGKFLIFVYGRKKEIRWLFVSV